jgi:hypothetical protein
MTAFARLDWESDHFGLLAAQITSADLSEAALARTLRLAREQGVELLVWATTQGRAAPSELLDGYGGKLVDRKATFSRTLEGLSDGEGSPRPSDFKIVFYSGADASVELIKLAIAAGGYSRFRIDPRLPHEKFRRMYGLWIARSVKKELADPPEPHSVSPKLLAA